jgi:hypothetical protein
MPCLIARDAPAVEQKALWCAVINSYVNSTALCSTRIFLKKEIRNGFKTADRTQLQDVGR